MSSLRLEIEQAMGLKFPERNQEALVRFEESLEIPRGAEELMRGFYRHPERVKQGFQNLHLETASILDLLLPRRSRLREWAEALPERPQDAEAFLKETGQELGKRQERLVHIERELLEELEESRAAEIFPLSLSIFGTLNIKEPAVKIYLRPLGRIAELAELNPESVRQAVRVHFLVLLLLVAGQDLDGQSYARGGDESTLHTVATVYAWRYLKRQSTELIQCYQEWLKAWGGQKPAQGLIADGMAEKLRAAMIFWRRRGTLGWEEGLQLVGRLQAKEEGRDTEVYTVRL